MSRKLAEDLKAVFDNDPILVTFLPGQVWTRRVQRNVANGPVPTEGSTPGAFDQDGHGNVLACMSILPENEIDGMFAGPLDSWSGTVNLWFWCLPHKTQQALIDNAINHIAQTYARRPLYLDGKPIMIRPAGRTGWLDDPDILRSTVTRMALQVDGARR